MARGPQHIQAKHQELVEAHNALEGYFLAEYANLVFHLIQRLNVSPGSGNIVAKAIKINKDNRAKLEGEYGLEEGELATTLGYWMLVIFGFKQVEGYLSEQNFHNQFKQVRELENGWVEVRPVE